MKQNIKYIIFLFILFLINIVQIKGYTCSYDAKFNDSVENSEFEVDLDNKKIETTTIHLILDSYIENQYTDSKLIELMQSGCPDYTYVCKHNTAYSKIVIDGVKTRYAYSFIINSDLYNSFSQKIEPEKEGYVVYTTAVLPSDCVVAPANKEKSTGKIIKDLFKCSYFDKKKEQLNLLYCNLTDEDCSSSQISLYNKKLDEISSWCNTVLQYADYVNPCAKRCLNLDLEIKTNGSPNMQPICGFSDKLIQWIANIVKWLKYIVPVIVIVLGILDFIKAIASEKDDEMKKAQGRFTKRLIAAALIFIIPFIIEFILVKMGFTANACGIIDL